MKDYLANEVRNVTVLGHSGAGKSSLIEACLFKTKAIEKIGKNNDGTTALNFDAEEGKRGVSVYAHLAPVEWKNKKKLPSFPLNEWSPFDSRFCGELKNIHFYTASKKTKKQLQMRMKKAGEKKYKISLLS